MLTQVAENVWCAKSDLKMPGKIYFPCRMTVVRLAGESLLIYSPIEITAELAGSIDALGKVRWVVAPNGFHHLFLRSAIMAWPEAELWASPSLPQKRKNLAFTGVLDGEVPAPWSDDLTYRRIMGAPKMEEIVLYHPSSKTLIVTDLVFHIHQCKNLRTRLLLKLVGAYQKVAQSRAWRLFVKEKVQASKSVIALFQWDFQRIIMAHGEIVETNARANLTRALRWMLKGQIPPEVHATQ